MTDVLMPAAESGIRSAFIATLRDLEWRQAGNSRDFTLTGTAAVFNSWSEELWTPRGSFRERILPGAFDDVLAGSPDVRLLFNHDRNLVLARTKSGTLELTADGEALRVWARVAPTSYANDLRIAMERGDVDQMSFNFDFDPDKGAQDRWYEDKQTREILRDVIKVNALHDVSPVTFPAYVDTTAAMRSMSRLSVTERVKEYDGLSQNEVRRREGLLPLERRSERSRYARTVQLISETPWAIHPSALATILTIVRDRADGGKLTDDEIRERIGGTRDRVEQPSGGVAVLALHGPILPRANLFTEVSGLTALEEFQASFRGALTDPDVSAIVLDVDSPGGVVDQVPEMADEIRAARGQKPIVAVANTMAASAAYWIATAADELVVTKSGEVGSIGVYAAHEDISGMEEKLGIKTTLVSAGKYKTEANPFEPLSDEARAEIQRSVDEFYGMFVAAVAKGRGVSRDTVRSDFGQGRMLSATRAVKARMADRIETLDETIARLTPSTGRRPSRQPAQTPTDLPDLPDSAFESRSTLRHALGFTTTAAQAETDPVGKATIAPAETDPVDGRTSIRAPAETDPAVDGVDPLADLKRSTREHANREREQLLRLSKEASRL